MEHIEQGSLGRDDEATLDHLITKENQSSSVPGYFRALLPAGLATLGGIAVGAGTYWWLDAYDSLSETMRKVMQHFPPSTERDAERMMARYILDGTLSPWAKALPAGAMALFSRAAIIRSMLLAKARRRAHRIESEELPAEYRASLEERLRTGAKRMVSFLSDVRDDIRDAYWSAPSTLAVTTLLPVVALATPSIKPLLLYYVMEYVQNHPDQIRSLFSLYDQFRVASGRLGRAGDPLSHLQPGFGLIRDIREHYLAEMMLRFGAGSFLLLHSVVREALKTFSGFRTEGKAPMLAIATIAEANLVAIEDPEQAIHLLRKSKRVKEGQPYLNQDFTIAKLYVDQNRFDDALYALQEGFEEVQNHGKNRLRKVAWYLGRITLERQRRRSTVPARAWAKRLIDRAQYQEYYPVIEEDLEQRMRDVPGDPLPLFLHYSLCRFEDRPKKARDVLRRLLHQLERNHLLTFSERTARYTSDHLSKQIAIKQGTVAELGAEVRVTQLLRDMLGESQEMRVAEPLDIVPFHDQAVYVMQFERGMPLAEKTSEKLHYLERAAWFNGRLHSSIPRQAGEQDGQYYRRLEQRIRKSGEIPAEHKERLILALHKIADAYPPQYLAPMRDGHQENYIVSDERISNESSDDGQAQKEGREKSYLTNARHRLVGIDFEIKSLDDPAIDVIKLLHHGMYDHNSGSNTAHDRHQEIARFTIIEAYVRGFMSGHAQQRHTSPTPNQMMIEVLAKAPAVFLSYFCWSEGKQEKKQMRKAFLENTQDGMRVFEKMLPRKYRRHEKQYEVIGAVLQELARFC